MTETALDMAHASGDRLAFFNTLTGAELYLLLSKEAEGDIIDPEIFATDEGRYVLAFDRIERLAEFVGRPAPYAALSGRRLAGMLSGQGIGIALNADVAPSAELLTGAAVDWLAEITAEAPEEIGTRPDEIRPPNAPEALVRALDIKLATAQGLARSAYLVSTVYADGRRGHILGVIEAVPGAEAALAQAVAEALVFSGLEAGTLDVAFFDSSDPMAARLAAQGLRFDLPQAAEATPLGGPGLDPDAPPRLR